VRRLVSASLILLLCTLSFLFTTQDTKANGTVLRFDPATVVLGPDYCIGETFTLTARIDDVEDLYGFSLRIKWNTTYLDYVSHVAKVPVESYPDGLLYEPLALVRNEANATTGTYRLAATTLSPGLSFYGSGIAFEITFSVKYQPLRPEQDVIFSEFFTTHDLMPSSGNIYHSTEDCEVTIASFHPADLNNDMKVDIFDIVIGANAYGSTPIDPNWNPDCDLTEPYGAIDIFDIIIIALSYGEEYIP